MLRKVVPAKNEQASISQYAMHRRECPIHVVWIIESKTVHPIEHDAIELTRLEVPFQAFARIDDVLSSAKGLLAGIDFQGGEVLRLEEVGVVKRVPSAAHKQDALVLRTLKKFRKYDVFKDHSVPSLFPRVDSVGDQPAMDMNPKLFERTQRLALRFW